MNEILIRYLSDVFNAISFISGICGFACFILLFVFVMMDYFVEHKLTWKEVLQDSAFRFLCIVNNTLKLHKINKEGTVAVVLPKKLIEKLGWKEGDYIEVLMTESPNTLRLVNFDLVTNA